MAPFVRSKKGELGYFEYYFEYYFKLALDFEFQSLVRVRLLCWFSPRFQGAELGHRAATNATFVFNSQILTLSVRISLKVVSETAKNSR